MKQVLGRQPKLSNKDSIHSLFFFYFFLVILYVAVFLYCWDENSSSVLTLLLVFSE